MTCKQERGILFEVTVTQLSTFTKNHQIAHYNKCILCVNYTLVKLIKKKAIPIQDKFRLNSFKTCRLGNIVSILIS